MLAEHNIRCIKRNLIDSTYATSSPNRMFDNLFDPDNSNKWSNLVFGEDIGIIEIQIRTLSQGDIV